MNRLERLAPEIKRLVSDIKDLSNQYEDISGMIDGSVYYISKAGSYVTSAIEDPTEYAEYLEQTIKERRTTLYRLAQRFPSYFAGGNFEDCSSYRSI